MAACNFVKEYLLKHLTEDIAAHESGLYSEIGKAEPDMPSWKECEIENEIETERLAIAYNFWDRWIDARNHEWSYYPGVEQKDWPIIARQICLGLIEQWEPERMTDNFVFHPPLRPSKVSIWQRLNNLFQST